MDFRWHDGGGGPIPLERATAAPDRTGTWVLDRFQLRKELSAENGSRAPGDAEAWLARERDTRVTVAVRLYDAAGIERARGEAAALRAVLEHALARRGGPPQGVIRYVADGPVGAGWCVVTDHVDGATLAKVLRVTWPSPPRAIGWARQVCAALEACHDAGVVHGDLHPGKIVLSRDAVGRDKLVLIGFERAIRVDAPERPEPGLLAVTAPERLGAGPVGPAADQYAVGAVLYRLLARRYPFTDDEVRVGGPSEPPPLGQHAPGLRLPPGLEGIVLRCLSRSPGARFASIAELGRQLAAVEYLPQRDWVRVTGLDLTIPPSDREPLPAGAPFAPGFRTKATLAVVAVAALLGAVWLATTVP